MPFQKGKSGNPNGRKPLSDTAKAEQKEFKQLLKESTPAAFQNILQIANNPRHLKQFEACKFILEKGYGIDPKLLLEEVAENEPIQIEIITKKGQ